MVFLVRVLVEGNDADSTNPFISTIESLEDGCITAHGESPQAAVQNALWLFRETVDQCISDGSLGLLLGDSGIMQEVDAPMEAIKQAVTMIMHRSANGHKPVESDSPFTVPAWMIASSSEGHAFNLF